MYVKEIHDKWKILEINNFFKCLLFHEYENFTQITKRDR
jgi:hypothetical protein